MEGIREAVIVWLKMFGKTSEVVGTPLFVGNAP